MRGRDGGGCPPSSHCCLMLSLSPPGAPCPHGAARRRGSASNRANSAAATLATEQRSRHAARPPRWVVACSSLAWWPCSSSAAACRVSICFRLLEYHYCITKVVCTRTTKRSTLGAVGRICAKNICAICVGRPRRLAAPCGHGAPGGLRDSTRQQCDFRTRPLRWRTRPWRTSRCWCAPAAW